MLEGENVDLVHNKRIGGLISMSDRFASINKENYLKRIDLLKDKFPLDNTKIHPFNIPWLNCTDSIEIKSNVTFFVGENGSGKSTLLEAIAYQCGFNVSGGDRNSYYDVNFLGSSLGEYIRLSWFPKITKGFFQSWKLL